MALMLPLIGGWVAIGLAVIGLILISVGIYLSCSCRKQNRHEQFINDESPEEAEPYRQVA